ncbi:MAG: TetR/AcrR family transcriptional regulator [Aestuariivirga sp.]
MHYITTDAFEPRKTPLQARSTVTVEAIHEATIQVLLSEGVKRTTTTRVAKRAGVSVGTLYQYYSNKQSLLFAVLEAKLNKTSEAMEIACKRAHGKPIAEIAKDAVEAYVDAKMQSADVSAALYRISAEFGGPELMKRLNQRSQKALEAALRTAPDATQRRDSFAIQMVLAAMAGTTRSVLEAGGSPAMFKNLRHHLVVLCQSYLVAIAQPAFEKK